MAQKAIDSNPEVSAKFNAFKAAADEVDIAAGAFKPKLNLDAGLGYNKDRLTNRRPEEQSLKSTGVSLSASQLLWDGFATRGEVGRATHAKLARYFEFLDATEQAALETGRALYDVQRYRRLVNLAEQNYVQHKYAFDQIDSRFKAGVGRGVDMEQAGARLALADSNLVTERANLHDVTERYRRIVGELPPADLGEAIELARPLPASSSSALQATPSASPVVAAAIENLRSVRAELSARKAPYQPKVEARLRGGVGHNFDNVATQKQDIMGQLVLNWNLFNGGIDQARERQAANLLNQAMDYRDKACRDTRQTVAIAYNDVGKLSEQLAYLERNVIAIERARDAYRQQFDIGQRSLLDLLNSENELYTAKRAQVMSAYDLQTAKLRTYAGMGTLVSALGLTRQDTGELASEANEWAVGDDASTRCPLTPTVTQSVQHSVLDGRASALVKPAAVSTAAAAAVVPAAAPVAAAAPASIAEQRLRDWAAAWMSKDLNRYFSFYSDQFGPIKANKPKWLAERRRLVGKPGEISVKLDNIQARTLSPTQAQTTFDQTYHSNDYSDTMTKTLTWEHVGADWLIVAESNR